MTEPKPDYPYPAGEIANAVEAEVMDPDRLFRPAADFDQLRDERDRWRAEAKRQLERQVDAARIADLFSGARDERDRAIRAMEAEVDGSREAWAKVAEARRVAGVLADALREIAGTEASDDPDAYLDVLSIAETARSALAVFDTLTEEKTNEGEGDNPTE